MSASASAGRGTCARGSSSTAATSTTCSWPGTSTPRPATPDETQAATRLTAPAAAAPGHLAGAELTLITGTNRRVFPAVGDGAAAWQPRADAPVPCGVLAGQAPSPRQLSAMLPASCHWRSGRFHPVVQAQHKRPVEPQLMIGAQHAAVIPVD